MSIRTKILLLVLPLLTAPLFISSIVSSFSARNGITQVTSEFLRFKAEELRDYARQQWDILEENSLAENPRFVEIAKNAVSGFAAGLVRSPSELIAAFDPEGALVMSTAEVEIRSEEAEALKPLAEAGRSGWVRLRLGGADRVAEAFVCPYFGWYVLVSEREDRFYSAVREIFRRSAYILAASVILSVALLLAFSRYLTEPLRRLERTMNEVMETNDLSRRAEVRFSDEIGSLAVSFNGMASALDDAYAQIKNYALEAALSQKRERKIRNIFQKYVPENVIVQFFSRPEAQLQGDERVLTVLFSDIVGFTGISERLKPSEVVDSLNHYFERMVDIIVDETGIVDKYIGDAIMAFFGAPVSTGQDAVHGVESGLRIIDALEDFNRWQAAKGRPPFRSGVGLNHGMVTIGNIGSDKKMEYTVIGDMVNTASRIEGLTRVYQEPMLVSASVYKEVRHRYPCRFVDKVAVKGRQGAVSVFSVRREIGPAEERVWKYYHAGVRRYYDRAFEEARSCFAAVLHARPGDGGAARFLSRCEECIKEPPGESWTGTVFMTEK